MTRSWMNRNVLPAAARHTCRLPSLRARIFLLAPAVMALWALTGSAPGQGVAAASDNKPVVLTGEGGVIQASIHWGQVAQESVTISAGGSAVVDVNVPITRAEIANPQVATLTVLSPRQVLIAGQTIGTTQAILWDEKENRLVFAVAVEPDLAQLKAAIAKAAPDAAIEVQVVRDTVILSGSVADVDAADRVVGIAKLVSPNVQNQIVVAGQQQVLLRCTVAEVFKTAARQLGVDGWLDVQEQQVKVPANDFVGFDPALHTQSETYVLGRRFLFGADTSELDPYVLIAPSTTHLRMELFIRALETNRLMRILAEPNLVALSGQTAQFLAGGQFPVPVPQATAGGVTITIEWKDYGIILQFLPTVIGRQMVRLQVATEVSDLDFANAVEIQGFFIPGVTQRRAQTTIELASGSTIAIAGLLNETSRGLAQKIPGLGDLPVLGPLFRSVEYEKRKTELVILVTPELVSAMHPDQVPPVPGQNMRHPNDWQLYGLGMLEGEPVADDPARTAALDTEIAPHYRRFASPPDQMALHGPWGPAEASETVYQGG